MSELGPYDCNCGGKLIYKEIWDLEATGFPPQEVDGKMVKILYKYDCEDCKSTRYLPYGPDEFT